MTLDDIRNKARANQLEVEHILQAAARRLPGLDGELESLIAACGWTDGGPISGGGHEIPFRRWAITAIAFLRDGYGGLHQLAMQGEYLGYVLGLLKELRCPEAVEAAISLRPKILGNPEADLGEAVRFASAFNNLLSFKPMTGLLVSQSGTIRDFLHRLLPLCNSDTDRATAVLALRGVGDASSLALIASQLQFAFPYEDVLPVTTKAIRNRLRDPA